MTAVFYPAQLPGAHKRELAAFVLDEMLGFGLVPITVVREITDEPGVLQLAYPDLTTEARRKREGNQITGACSLPMQQQLLEVFDLLIGNTGRSGSAARYTLPLWDLEAVENGDTFNSAHTLPKSAEKLAPDLPQSLRTALLSLDTINLTMALGEHLEDEQIAALLSRRDAILKIMPHPEESYGHPVRAAMDDRHQ